MKQARDLPKSRAFSFLGKVAGGRWWNFLRRNPLPNSAAAALAASALVLVSDFLSSRHAMAEARMTEDASAGRRHRYDLLDGLELILFDWRAREATKLDNRLSPRLALLHFDDLTVKRLRAGYVLNESFGLLFPRHLYARALRELTAQGVRGVAFDVTLQDERPDHEAVEWPVNGAVTNVASDEAFTSALKASGRTALGADFDSPPAPDFRNAAARIGSVDSPRDVDGAARRVFAFVDCRTYSDRLLRFAKRRGFEVEPGSSDSEVQLFDYRNDTNVSVRLSQEGMFEEPVGKAGRIAAPAFETRRVWHLGIVLAAMELGLDLDHAEIGPGQIVLRSTNSPAAEPRIIQVDAARSFPVDWAVASTRIPGQKLEDVINDDESRQRSPDADHARFWQGKLAVVGSTASGNNLTDLGPTPLAPSDFLVATYVNVANSVLQNRFIRRPSLACAVALTLVFAMAGGWVTWSWRPAAASAAVAAVSLGYIGFAFWIYIRHRWWVPIAHPIVGGLLLNHAAVLSWRVLFEQSERQRVRSVFARIVAPEVVHELLGAERVGLGGARRRMTVFFADVRGFTEMTDRVQAEAEAHVSEAGLDAEAAEAHFEARAGEVLDTVNLYLGTLAEIVKVHQGTLDKYIGDCVMAFWGAPTADERHAVRAVLAAVDAQRAVARLNLGRASFNETRAEGVAPLPLLQLGTGINTGYMTVGLMGSDAHIVNYTVFGREVNLASRLEGVSGRGRIIIGEGTHSELLRFAPELAGRCVALPPVAVKGFRQPVQVFEVPWAEPTAPDSSTAS